ncbi:MAG: phosphoadenylyl-sulfate reductase [Cloacibacterium sp.]|jgi:phosphoadenosine phosphosulfate reductase|nr:phosphoadenylyl-sulfate reductase [Cloacibacterium sp.]
MKSKEIQELKEQLSSLSIEDVLSFLAEKFGDKVVFSSSFGMEDQVITHYILHHQLPIRIFTLDTGRIFEETYKTWENTNVRYHTKIQAYYPHAQSVEDLVRENGPNCFYDSTELRKKCCYIRKVEPLNRALEGKEIWITGLRAQQSSARENLEKIEWDETNHIIKFHPLLHWSLEEVKEFIKTNQIPYNHLHDKGFVSIGCAPCTRAIKEGEDFRAGRWWWEDQSKKECGLHWQEPK